MSGIVNIFGNPFWRLYNISYDYDKYFCQFLDASLFPSIQQEHMIWEEL